MREYNISIFGFAETNLAWNPSLVSTTKYYDRKVFKQFQLVCCSSDDPASSFHQPGGVCMGVTRKTTGRILETTRDPLGLGRWVLVLCTGTDRVKQRVVTSYRVCQDSVGEKSKYTANKQQYQVLKSKKVENQNPQKQWCIDLEKQIIEWRKQSPVLLLCDVNSDLLDDKLGAFLSNTGLYDISAMKHGMENPKTYIMGTNTLDYGFCTIEWTQPLRSS
eukprot:5091085-Ditylum_brightwellii.AAC.1